MKQVFLRKSNSDTLKLFFCGYGQDINPFVPLCEKGDVALVYEYDEALELDESPYKDYKNIELIAWSIGVMVASYVMPKTSLLKKITKAIAVNGTPCGIAFEGNLGLPSALWYQSYENMNEEGQENFTYDMLGKDPQYYLEHPSKRSAQSCKSELLALYNFKKAQKTEPSFIFDEVYVGLRDKIFPASLVRKAFLNTNTKIIKGSFAHFDKDLFLSLLN